MIFSPALWFRKWRTTHNPRRQARPRLLCLEALEDRITPASFGFPWPDAQHLTLSFVPDGTVVGNSTSNFFQKAGSPTTATAWEMEILRAFQTWAVQTHVSISLVPDTGAALGTPGLLEGDPRFGDIRIAFVPTVNHQITGASNASPIVIASAGHGLSTGQPVTIANVLGNTAANGAFTITKIDADHFSLNGSAGNGAYTSGGTWAANFLATAVPFDITAGTWSGDVIFNSSDMFAINPPPGSGLPTPPTLPIYDLYSVALHEAGHALSVTGNTTDQYSAMFEFYNRDQRTGPNGLNTGDSAAIQSLYGLPSSVEIQDDAPNHSLATAEDLLEEGFEEFAAHAVYPGTTPNEGSLTLYTVDSTVLTPGETDYFRYQATCNAPNFTVSLQTSGISLLDAKLTVLDAAGNVVQSTVAADPMHGNLSIRIANANAGAVYYFKVEGGSTDVFGVGNYRLAVTPDNDPSPFTLDQFFSYFPGGELRDHGTMQTALTLHGAAAATNDRFDFTYYGKLGLAGDVDYYRFQSPDSGAAPQSMTVMVWGRDANGLLPAVTVFDASGNVVPATVLQNSNGTEIVQISNARSNATYFVSVQANASGSATGRYFLGIDFSTRSHELDQPFASGTVSTINNDPNQQAFRWVSVSANTVFHLDISAIGAPGTAIEVTLLDNAGNVVFDSNTALHGIPLAGGSTLSVNLFLAAANYELRVVGGASGGSQPSTIGFNVQGTGLTDPIDPQLIDPGSPPVIHPFLWQVDPLFRDFLALFNPYGNPIIPGRPPS
jgi:hypothetical protein